MVSGNFITKLRQQCIILELHTSLAPIDRLISYMETKDDDFYRTAADILQHIITVVPDELKSRTLLSLTNAEAELY